MTCHCFECDETAWERRVAHITTRYSSPKDAHRAARRIYRLAVRMPTERRSRSLAREALVGLAVALEATECKLERGRALAASVFAMRGAVEANRSEQPLVYETC